MRNRMPNLRSRARRRAARWQAVAVLGLLLLWPTAARAQDDSQQGAELEGINGERYNVKQSIEFGGRLTSVKGNENLYDTFVNLQQGARLLGFTTEMRPIEGSGGLFDNFYVNAYGWGGDPNDITKVRINKRKWYDFGVLIRRDQNAWDYSLLANPLNPTNGFVNGPAGFGPLATSTCTSCVLGNSPHLMDTRRYLSDYDLLLFPESTVRLRMGYSRNVVVGPALSTYHLATEALLFQDVHYTVNTYRLGVDYRVAPRTNISYDEIWNDYKGDTSATDRNQTFLLSNGTPVDLGIAFNAPANQPCSGTFVSPTVVSPTCSAFISYFTHGRVRTSTPTEQISMQSSYWKPVDISGRFSYTAGDAQEFGYLESLLGRGSNNLLGQNTHALINGQRVSATGDLGVTWHINEPWSFLDSFHYSNFHNPMQYDPSVCSFFSTSMIAPANVFNPASPLPVVCTPPPGSVAGAAPAHTASSAADLTLQTAGGFLKQQVLTNLSEVDYQRSWRLGARIGFRYTHRDINDNSFLDETDFYFPSNAMRGNCPLGAASPGCTALGAGPNMYYMYMTPFAFSPFSTDINEYSGLFGIWARPVRNWRISFDTELMSADNVFTRISPRQSQEYRVRSVWKPVTWFNLNGSVRIWEGRDNVVQTDNLQHDRSYSITSIFQPNEKFALELSYSYNDVFSQILICYPSTPATPGTGVCGSAPTSGLVQQLSVYKNKSNYGSFDFQWTPVQHLTTHLGGNFTGTSGSALNLNPNQEAGPLNSKWLVPTAGMDYSFSKNWVGKAYWNYYGYHEDFTPVPQDIYAPRNFHANLVTLSVRYAF
jgi:hypothetical protein